MPLAGHDEYLLLNLYSGLTKLRELLVNSIRDIFAKLSTFPPQIIGIRILASRIQDHPRIAKFRINIGSEESGRSRISGA